MIIIAIIISYSTLSYIIIIYIKYGKLIGNNNFYNFS